MVVVFKQASKAIQPVDALREEAQLLVQAERYAEACVAFHRLLQEYDSDDWDYWTGYVGTSAMPRWGQLARGEEGRGCPMGITSAELSVWASDSDTVV